ncbi:MAG: ABC transporter permease [Spirochaetes bacterium]|nr:ABC transporter permease [Spirochaetota bacterium]
MGLLRLLKSSFKNIYKNRMRSLLTSLGIIIGVGSVIVMVAIGDGSRIQIEQQIASMGTNLITVLPRRGVGVPHRLTKSDSEKLKNEATYIMAVSGIRQRIFNIVGGDGNWSALVMGVEPDYLIIRSWNMQEGNFFEEEDLLHRRRVAVLGATVASQLFGARDPIGERIRIGTNHFRVTGVLERRGIGAAGNDQDDVVMVPLDTALTRMSPIRAPLLSSIALSVIHEDFMSRAQQEIDIILRESHNTAPNAPASFEILNMADVIARAAKTSRLLTNLLSAIAGVSLLVGGIGIMNIMLVSVTERTREIGIRMAVGARKKDILFQFLSESIILSLIGGIIGVVFAVFVCKFLTAFMAMPTYINPVVIMISVLFAAMVGIFFGFYPAKKAAGLYPIDALRYE